MITRPSSTRALRGARGLLGWFGRLVLALYLSTLAVFLVLEISIDGGMATVVLGAGEDLDNPRLAEQVEAYNFKDPVPLRHAKWFLDAAQFDFNRSSRGDRPVQPMLTPRLPISFEIAILALGSAVVIGLTAGFSGALLSRSSSKFAHTAVISTLQGTPAFILAAVATWVISVKYGLLPAAGWERLSTSVSGNLERALMPVLAIALPEAGIIARLVTTSTRSVLDEEFILAAQAKGLPRRQVIVRHALRPASMTLLTQLGLIFGSLLSGVIIVEQMFGIGGMGIVLEEASINRDLHVLAAITAYVTAIIVVIRGLSELVYRWADPRTRASF